MLAIYAHDDTVSVVSVNGYDGDMAWIQFGEITASGFSPCYAAIKVPTSDLRTVMS